MVSKSGTCGRMKNIYVAVVSGVKYVLVECLSWQIGSSRVKKHLNWFGLIMVDPRVIDSNTQFHFDSFLARVLEILQCNIIIDFQYTHCVCFSLPLLFQ